jgi:hypothetical protein
MRPFALIALGAAILAPLSAPARSDDTHDSAVGKKETSLKRVHVPSENMMRRDPGVTSLSPGAENRGSQLVDPARLRGGENPGAAVRTRDQDTPEAAAQRTKTNASRMGPSEAAATTLINGGSGPDSH